MKINLALFLLVITTITSCKKENTEQADELIFGTHYGMCGGNCFKVFGLNNEQLQRDTTENYLPNYLTYNFTGSITLHDSLFQQVNHLLNEIPAELFTLTEKTYGCPDCHDQGGIYIELNRNGVTRRFNIDNDSTSDQSTEIIEFKARIHAAVNAID
jgi:hypothetical protein